MIRLVDADLRRLDAAIAGDEPLAATPLWRFALDRAAPVNSPAR